MSKNTITNIVTPNLDQLTPLVDSRYTLVTLAAKRARDIMEEIYEGKITYKRLNSGIK